MTLDFDGKKGQTVIDWYEYDLTRIDLTKERIE